MAKFCTNCGKELKAGEKHECAKGDVAANEMVNGLAKVCKGMFTKPIDTIKGFVGEANFIPALIIVGVLAVLTGLFSMSLAKNAEPLIMASMGCLGSMRAMSFEIPYAKMFFTALIFLVVFAFIFAGLLYVVNTLIFKRKSDFKETFTLYAVVMIPEILGVLAASILMFVHVGLGLLVFITCSVLSALYLYHGLKFLGKEDPNKYGYIYITTNAFCILVLFILSKIFS